MPNTIEDFKKNAPSFEPVFELVGQIIEMIKEGKPTDNLIQNCADIMVMKHHKMMKDDEVIKFMNLTATARCSCTMRRPFLKELILSALEQAIGKENGIEPHTLCVRKDVLEKSGFPFNAKTKIDDLSRKIEDDIPQIGCIFIEGMSSARKDDIRFSLGYNFQLKAEFDSSKKLVAV